MSEETIEGYEGHPLNLYVWRPDGPARGVVVINHGFKAHAGQYAWAAGVLNARGFAVYAHDMRSFGKSPGERYFVEKAAGFIADLALVVSMVKMREPGLPVFLLGHSAGGVVSSTYVLDNPEGVKGFICESFAFEVYAPDFALTVLKGLSHIAPHAHVLDLKNEFFSRDPAHVAAMDNDPLIPHDKVPALTVAEMVRMDTRLEKEFPQITTPVFILHGTDDKVTKPHGSQVFFDTTGSVDKTLRFYEGHYHDLLADLGKEQVIDDITAWIEARL